MSRTRRKRRLAGGPVIEVPDGHRWPETQDPERQAQHQRWQEYVRLEREAEKRLAPKTRKRRGKEVEIPPEWQGQVARPQTASKRRQLAKEKRKERRRELRRKKRLALLDD